MKNFAARCSKSDRQFSPICSRTKALTQISPGAGKRFDPRCHVDWDSPNSAA